MTRWGTTRPEFESPRLNDAWVRAQGVWRALAGTRPEVMVPSVVAFLDAVREAALRQRLSGGQTDWAALASDLRAAEEPLRTLLEDLADLLTETVELVEGLARNAEASKRRRADAGEGGARGKRSDDRAEEATTSAQTRTRSSGSAGTNEHRRAPGQETT